VNGRIILELHHRLIPCSSAASAGLEIDGGAVVTVLALPRRVGHAIAQGRWDGQKPMPGRFAEHLAEVELRAQIVSIVATLMKRLESRLVVEHQ